MFEASDSSSDSDSNSKLVMITVVVGSAVGLIALATVFYFSCRGKPKKVEGKEGVTDITKAGQTVGVAEGKEGMTDIIKASQTVVVVDEVRWV
jgi:hypothetical protein